VSENNELGAFLRACREAVSPAEVGLPSGPRRRTPGLRRSELATLAGISVEYLTRLEQGRDRHPSPQVLSAIADALGLSTDERLHLRLMTKRGAGLTCPASAPASTIRPTVQALLDRMEPTPAIVVNRLGDVLAHTSGYERIAPPGLLDARPSNLARYLFTDPRARTAYPDWERVATQQLAYLKIESYRDDPHIVDLTEELTVTAGAAFADRLASTTTLPRRTGIDRLTHPQAGPLTLAFEVLELPDANNQRLIVYLPADETTTAALSTPTNRHLRAVPD
jgi:transcriptional regulator with XRE-family HTH domain